MRIDNQSNFRHRDLSNIIHAVDRLRPISARRSGAPTRFTIEQQPLFERDHIAGWARDFHARISMPAKCSAMRFAEYIYHITFVEEVPDPIQPRKESETMRERVARLRALARIPKMKLKLRHKPRKKERPCKRKLRAREAQRPRQSR